MNDHSKKMDQLSEKLEMLWKQQRAFSGEIRKIEEEIQQLKDPRVQQVVEKKPVAESAKIVEPGEATAEPKTVVEQPPLKTEPKEQVIHSASQAKKAPKIKRDFEKFIGENLINKIGIIITIIGVSIGTKYAIDNQMISPLTRIILGYLFGLGLMGVAIKLKKNYENFSAVLVSGSMAILYIITYIAYSLYALLPQFFAFTLMVFFTVFTVIAALQYNRQVIAHIGLVGAYAVPFLLSEDTGRVGILFSYMVIINSGILIVSFKKYWKPLFYSSFIFTWAIYFSWYLSDYIIDDHFGLGLSFLFTFFMIFYLAFLSYKLLKNEKFEMADIHLLLANSFVFYGTGYSILSDHATGEQLLGLFTLSNAIIHFIVSIVIYRQKLADKNLFYLVSGLVLVFITITIPVQLNGNWVTLLWAGEAALLFHIGRTRNFPFYEKLSYSLMVLAFFSITHDWTTVYNNYFPGYPDTRITFLFNVNFLTSVLFIASFSYINMLNNNSNYSFPFARNNQFGKIINFIIPSILLITVYYAFFMEIATYWQQLFSDSGIQISSEGENSTLYFQKDYDLLKYKSIWLINYSLLFTAIMVLVNWIKIKNKNLGLISLGLCAIAMAVFLTEGLYTLSELRESYLQQTLAEYYHIGIFNIIIRYISYIFAGFLLTVGYQYLKKADIKNTVKKVYDFSLHLSVLWMLSSEFLNLMDIIGSDQSYKLGLSILWGFYALFMVAAGIWKKKQHLRIGAIVLLGVTLIKLFFYDISHLDTIPKTIVFISLGILLLIISFLYNKFKKLIFIENEGTHEK